MSKNSISENFPNHFQRESLNLINGLLPLSSSGFYLVGADMRHRVVCIDEQLPEEELLASFYYREFMRPLQHRHAADMFFRRRKDIIGVLAMLREAELDVAELIVAGASNKIIARELALSLATLKTHIQHIFHKVEVSSRTALSARVVAELNPRASHPFA